MVSIAVWGSRTQIQSLGLRYEVLRRPLGLFFDPDDLAAEQNEIHIVASENEEVTGVMLLKPLLETELKMRQVAVAMHRQGCGVGKEMVRFAERWARDHGFQSISLHARLTAVPFYLTLDYCSLGDEFFEVDIPHVKMRKEL